MQKMFYFNLLTEKAYKTLEAKGTVPVKLILGDSEKRTCQSVKKCVM